ncbi:hypothetical protein JOM56_003787, partial [Amanita muscaria]
FSRDAIKDSIAQFVACDNQALAVADKVTFRNCLVTMRPRTTKNDLPSTHEIATHIHNKFVKWMTQLR